MSNTQYQRVTLEKNFFWHGVLVINDTNYHSFFDVKTKKDVPDAPNMIGLYTSDVPALPLAETDTMQVSFSIENNIGGNSSRFKVVEASLSGADLVRATEEYPVPPPNVVVTNEMGEWQYSLQDKTYILRSILVFVSLAQLRKYVKDP